MFSELLTTQHRQIEKKLKEVMGPATVDAEALTPILRELQHHMAAEEKHLYPLAEDALTHKERSKLVEHSYKEHTELKDYIIKLGNTDYVSQDSLKNDINSLYDILAHHHKDEEEDVFPKLIKELPEKQIESLSLSVAAFLENASGYALQ